MKALYKVVLLINIYLLASHGVTNTNIKRAGARMVIGTICKVVDRLIRRGSIPFQLNKLIISARLPLLDIKLQPEALYFLYSCLRIPALLVLG